MPLRDTALLEPSWPVKLFRFTESNGWQTQKVGTESTGIVIEASPRQDCIVIPALHQKFSLSNDSGDKGTVIRRNHCMLLISRTRTKVMVLQFRSIQDCLDFSDRFITLNPAPTTNLGNEKALVVSAEAHRESVTAHLVRLMHDPTFETFVRDLESNLQSTTDGAQILDSWIHRDFARGNDETM